MNSPYSPSESLSIGVAYFYSIGPFHSNIKLLDRREGHFKGPWSMSYKEYESAFADLFLSIL
jgi:hypothetical protein